MNGRTITLLGDLKNDRAVHSLVYLLSLYPVRLNFISPTSLVIPPAIISAAHNAGIPVAICDSLDDVLADTDVLFVTEIQRERFKDEQEWLHVNKVDHGVLLRAKKDMFVMHPLSYVNSTFPVTQVKHIGIYTSCRG